MKAVPPACTRWTSEPIPSCANNTAATVPARAPATLPVATDPRPRSPTDSTIKAADAPVEIATLTPDRAHPASNMATDELSAISTSATIARIRPTGSKAPARARRAGRVHSISTGINSAR